MCFEVPALVPPGGPANGNKGVPNDDVDGNDDDLGIMDIDDNDNKAGKSSSTVLQFTRHPFEVSLTSFCYSVGKNTAELEALNESLHDLLDGIQVFIYLMAEVSFE